MSAQTGISWTDSTFNPWMGCTKVSPACDHCYAERDTHRFGRVEWGAGKPRVRTSAANWKLPERWNSKAFFECPDCGLRWDHVNPSGLPHVDHRAHACTGCDSPNVKPTRRRVFCASLGDWLDNEVPVEWLVDLLDLIRRTPNLDWLLLTKRIGNLMPRLRAAADHARAVTIGLDDPLAAWINDWHNGKPPANVWIGATVENQKRADEDIEKLVRASARVRFLSIEPMLGPVALPIGRVMTGFPQHIDRHGNAHGAPLALHWIICGGESGPHARPMHPDWIRSLRDQCASVGVPFHFKQWGEWAPREAYASECMESDEIAGKWEGSIGMYRFGTRAAGRLLDGREHNGFPAVRP